MSETQEWNIPLTGKKTVAIVGFAPSSFLSAPYQNEAIEIWGINELPIVQGVSRVTRLFQLHTKQEYSKGRNAGKIIDWMKSATIPIYIQEKEKEFPSSVRFPIKEVLEISKTNYFTNSISYIIAFAILQGAKKIELWGVDMARIEEYEAQSPSVEYFIGWARGLGVEGAVPSQSDILHTTHLYGYQEEELLPIQNKLLRRNKELIDRHAQAMAKTKRSAEEEAYILGARHENEQVQKAYFPLKYRPNRTLE